MSNLEQYIKTELDLVLRKHTFASKVFGYKAPCHPIYSINAELEVLEKQPTLISEYLKKLSNSILQYVESKKDSYLYTASASAVYGEVLMSIQLTNGLNVFLVDRRIDVLSSEICLTVIIE